MATGNLNITVPATGAAGPGWANNIQDALQKIDDAAQLQPKAFGVQGDWNGSTGTDDSANLQSVFSTLSAQGRDLIVPAGCRIRVTRNLYLHGRINIFGRAGSQIILDADLGAADGVTYWVNFGIPGKGGTPDTFSGVVSGLEFVCTANAHVLRVLNFHKADTYGVFGCRLDATAMTTSSATQAAGLIAGSDDGSWCASPSRQKAWFAQNRIAGPNVAAPGQEAISHANCPHLWITDNDITGVADDAIGVHWSNRVFIARNNCRISQGRIVVTNTKDFKIVHNHVERIARADATIFGGGGLIYACQEFPSTGFGPCDGGLIEGNTCVLPAVPSATYDIRLQGARNTEVLNNKFRHANSNGGGVSVEAQTLAGWVDATGVEPDSKARARNIRVSGNRTIGVPANPVNIQTAGVADDFPGPIHIDNNYVDTYQTCAFATYFSSSNRVVNSDPTKLTSLTAAAIPDATIVFTATGSVVSGAAGSILNMGVGVLDRWIAKKAGLLVALDVTLDAALTTNGVFVQLMKNGVGTGNVYVDTSTPRGKLIDLVAVGNFAVGDYLQVQITPSANAPTPVGIIVRGLAIFV